MIQPNNSKCICQVDKLPNLVPFQRLFEGSTGPTPAQHLLWLQSLDHHPYAISLYLRTKGAPCQPGLCSFPADGIVTQVDCPHGFVDLQRFGKGLWPERWWAGRLTMRSTEPHAALWGGTIFFIITSESVRREGEQTLKLNFICKGRSRDRNSWTYVPYQSEAQGKAQGRPGSV